MIGMIAWFAAMMATPAWAAGASNRPDQIIYIGSIILIFVLFVCVYFLPYFIGRKRGINSRGALFFVNLFFGLTGIGWFACLIWAATGATKAQDEYFKRESLRNR